MVKTAIGLLNAPAYQDVSVRDSPGRKAIDNIKEAIEGYVAVLKEDGLPVPEDPFDTILIAV